MPSAPLALDEERSLAALRNYEILDTVSEAEFDVIVRLTSRRTGCPISLISLVDAERQWFKTRHALEATETPHDSAFCSYTILDPSKEPLIKPVQ